MNQVVKSLGKKTKLEGDCLWKTTRKYKRRVEVLDSAEAIRKALILKYEHRQLGWAYEYSASDFGFWWHQT